MAVYYIRTVKLSLTSRFPLRSRSQSLGEPTGIDPSIITEFVFCPFSMNIVAVLLLLVLPQLHKRSFFFQVINLMMTQSGHHSSRYE